MKFNYKKRKNMDKIFVIIISIIQILQLSYATEVNIINHNEYDFILPGNIMYQENEKTGIVSINKFDIPVTRMDSAPVYGNFNPSSKQFPCSHLGEGKFPVYGDCSRYIECIVEKSDESYIRSIKQCHTGFWFNMDKQGCTLIDEDICPYGYETSSPTVIPEFNYNMSIVGPDNCVSGNGLYPYSLGFYACIANEYNTYDIYTYSCEDKTIFNGEKCTLQYQNETIDNSVSHHDARENIIHECARTCTGAGTRTCKFTFVIEEYASMSSPHCKDCINNPSDCNRPGCIPAGGVVKPIITINQQLPGPLIEACKGDRLEINVINKLPGQATTIHWHGLHQKTTCFMDGVPLITQCPIHPGNSFKYSMIADISGTHLYHSHMGHQESDGMFGPMIIREPKNKEFGIENEYDLDESKHYILVWHWSETPGEVESVNTRYLSLIREGYGYLINGKGTVAKVYGKSGTKVTFPMERYYVKTGFRYRFRAIFNTALGCPIQVSLDDHYLRIIATDGRPVKPFNVDSFILNAGERVDFVPYYMFNTTKPLNRTFFIRVQGLKGGDCDDNKNSVHQTAVLHYDDAVTDPPSTKSYVNSIRFGTAFNLPTDVLYPHGNKITAVSLLRALDADSTQSNYCAIPDKIFYLKIGFNAYQHNLAPDSKRFMPQINDITWKNPPSPPITQRIDESIYCNETNKKNCLNGLCSCTHMLEIPSNKLIEIVFVDQFPGGPGHPIHMHGYAFKVIAIEQFPQPIRIEDIKAANEAGKIPKNYNGPLKDTINVPAGGYSIIRFKSKNPGYWFLHCHISEHMELGMALVMKVGSPNEMTRPRTTFPQCGNWP